MNMIKKLVFSMLRPFIDWAIDKACDAVAGKNVDIEKTTVTDLIEMFAQNRLKIKNNKINFDKASISDFIDYGINLYVEEDK